MSIITENDILELIKTIDTKFELESNLTANKLEYINLVETVEDEYDFLFSDEVLNEITNVQDLINETLKQINNKGA